ncbi:hypothetical protein NIES22_65560 [Calothrix brevissima NIES-22]|nr:hypothetical protein NIES22_65560 [Calothrix brevissima NIES-22]
MVQKSPECSIYGEFYGDKSDREGEGMGCSSFHTKNYPMSVPHLYRQVQDQVSQWIHPQDQRHLQVFCENVAAILQAQSIIIYPF